jgi:hypothetical protein
MLQKLLKGDISDVWLWIGVAAGTAVLFIHLNSTNGSVPNPEQPPKTSDDTPQEAPSSPKFTGTINLAAENAVDAASLATLTRHPNQHIRSAALSILINRVLSSESTKDSIAHDYNTQTSPLHTQSRHAITFLRKRDRWALWPAVPTLGIRQVAIASHSDAPSPPPPNFGRRIEEDLAPLSGLPASSMFREFDQGPRTFRLPTGGRTVGPTTRLWSFGSEADRDVRRRRREAFVLNEGDHPLTQDDIIQGPISLAEQVQREWERPHWSDGLVSRWDQDEE